jgi:hypothetical protein
MNYSTIEGMIKQSTGNPIQKMDTQLQNYQALKNGVPVPMSKGTLQEVIDWIRVLESGLDRYTQHSPYTVGRI